MCLVYKIWRLLYFYIFPPPPPSQPPPPKKNFFLDLDSFVKIHLLEGSKLDL